MNRSDDLFPQPGGTPDPYWQRAFDDAFDTPPPRVWEGVERQLDLDESDGILPLWQHREGRQSMLFGRWAAGIAASLLLTALGWWAWHREDAIRPDARLAVTTAPVNGAPTESGTSLAPVGPAVASTEATQTRPLHLPQLASTRTIARRQVRSSQSENEGKYATGVAIATPDASTPGTLPNTDDKLVVDDNVIKQVHQVAMSVQPVEALPVRSDEAPRTVLFTETTTTSTMLRMKGTEPQPSTLVGIQPSATRSSFSMQSFSMQSVTIQSRSLQLPPDNGRPTALASVPAAEQSLMPALDASGDRLTLAVDPLVPKQLVIRPLGNDRIVWYRNEEPTAEPASITTKKQKERPWLSAGLAASSFNPAVAVRSVFSPALNATQNYMSDPVASTPILQNQLGRAVAFQAGLGIPLGEHWSVETGVGYLNGQNQVQSPGRVSSLTSAAKSASTSNLYTDLVGRLASQPAYASSAVPITSGMSYDYNLANQANSYASSAQQSVSNSYQFVQVPVQVG
ncbi:MAG: hypothetical protein EOO39_06820, partial [Cytophagaceae bacterium]